MGAAFQLSGTLKAVDSRKVMLLFFMLGNWDHICQCILEVCFSFGKSNIEHMAPESLDLELKNGFCFTSGHQTRHLDLQVPIPTETNSEISASRHPRS